MSRKWQRVKRWDNEHLSAGPLRPLKWVLRALSSISLAISLLVLVAIYGVFASVPIGLLALLPVWLVIGLLALLACALPAVGAGALVRAAVPKELRGLRFAGTVLAGIALAVAGGLVFAEFAWQPLYRVGSTGEGIGGLAAFVEDYSSTTLRRLPGFEMSELEFYSWWPFRLVLVLFTINMIVATLRRIEFSFKNLGVLTVHTGIVMIALAGAFYQQAKKEGDTILFAGAGAPETGFFDIDRTALWVRTIDENLRTPWEQRPVRGVPRYNDYGLDASVPEDADLLSDLLETAGPVESPRRLDVRVPDSLPATRGLYVEPTLKFRLVGYSAYGAIEETLALQTDAPADRPAEPVQVIEFVSKIPQENAVSEDPDAELIPELARLSFRFPLRPLSPAHRVARNPAFGIELTRGMPDERFLELGTRFPRGTLHGLIVTVPESATEAGGPLRVVIPASEGEAYSIGDSGWTVAVKDLADDPPFPIITEGFAGGTSSVAILRMTSPEGESFDRWVYHRFPSINQELLDQVQANGRPSRRDPDPRIDVVYIDASRLQVFIDEMPGGARRFLVRQPGRDASVVAGDAMTLLDEGAVVAGDLREMGDDAYGVSLAFGESWAHGEPVEYAVPVPEVDRDASLIGTHAEAKLAVELTMEGVDGWREVVWLPFSRYLGVGGQQAREVELPTGQRVALAFGRVRHTFERFGLEMVDFEMISYDHRGAPRDFQSIVRVVPTSVTSGFDAYSRVVKLNAPLRAPHVWSEDRSWPANAALMAVRGVDSRAYKLSQAGWDQQGWQESQQLADQGLVDRPRARFTILQVGNNPGIHLIAIGGVLIGLGTPWAFYVKPWLVRRERERLARGAGVAREPIGAVGRVEREAQGAGA